MKISSYGIIAVFIVVIAVALAGCTFNKTIGTTTTSSGTTGSSSSSGQTASASATAATCPAVTAATSWTGGWDTIIDRDPCLDLRVAFYPPTTDIPDSWKTRRSGNSHSAPITFTQTGCSVDGSITSGKELSGNDGGLPAGCPITFKGTVDSTGAVKGTWKAYCNIWFANAIDGKTTDKGTFSLNMEPGGSTFIGSINTDDPGSIKWAAEECPTANSNWVGKRA